MQHWGEHMQKHPKDALKVASVAMAAVVTGTVVKNPMVKRQVGVPGVGERLGGRRGARMRRARAGVYVCMCRGWQYAPDFMIHDAFFGPTGPDSASSGSG